MEINLVSFAFLRDIILEFKIIIIILVQYHFIKILIFILSLYHPHCHNHILITLKINIQIKINFVIQITSLQLHFKILYFINTIKFNQFFSNFISNYYHHFTYWY